ncbi:MAG: SPOR domain-containing protein [Thiogranum sp.]|nr:SPOR domain-containing protein [Thiogranum sp.]
MEFLLKQRLVGAVVLVALGVIFIPMLLEGPDRNQVPELEALPELFDAGPEQPLESFQATDGVRDEPQVSVLGDTPPPDSSSDSTPAEAGPVIEPLPELPVAEPPVEQAAEPGPLGNWVVQAASFSDQEKAIALRDKLRAADFVTQVEKVRVEGKSFYRVRVGPYLERAEAEQNQKRLDEKFKLSARVLSYP